MKQIAKASKSQKASSTKKSVTSPKKKVEQTVIDGIPVVGKIERRKKLHPIFQKETPCVQFSANDGVNKGKIAVHLPEYYFGLIQEEIAPVCSKILLEGKNFFVVQDDCRQKENHFLMKYAENYAFFRIVDSLKEAKALCEMLDNYNSANYSALEGKIPFDVELLEDLNECLENDVQKAVFKKLTQTK